MGLRDRLADYFSKGNYSRLQKDNAIAMTRPGLGRYEKQQEFANWHLQNTAYFFEAEVSIFSEVVQALRREIFRNGIDWVPKFAVKCIKCGNEMQEKADSCDFCGSTEMREPNSAERVRFLYADGTSRIHKANANGQSLSTVLGIDEFHLDVVDLSYTLIQKAYLLEPDGSIKEAIPKEILALDPRDVDFIHDDLGNPGTKERICLRHRDKAQDSKLTKCPTCGGVLYEVHYRAGKLSGKTRYFIEGEVLQVSKYYPSLLGGYPPIMKMADDAWAYNYIEKRVKSYYEKARSPGLLTIPTNNPEAAYKTWKDCMTELRGDPYGVPWLNYDPEAKSPINYLPLMADPNPGMLEIKKEIRERMGARFGVSLIFQSDTSASGGLNNEGLQITVTNRAVEWGQSVYNEKVLPWICQQWGIKDWVLELNPSEEMDEMAEIQRLQANVTIAQTMLQMGFEVEYEDGEFKYSGQAKKHEVPPQLAPFVPGANPFQPQTPPPQVESPMEQEPTGTPGEQPKVEKSLDDMSYEEFVDSLFDKSYAFTNILWLLKAIMVAPLMGRFQKLAPQEAEDLYQDMIKEMIKPERWSITDISKVLRKKFSELTDFEAERIARTETTMIANKARELKYVEEAPGAKYVWIGPDDHRTTKICREIKATQPAEGLTLNDLKAHVRKVANANGETMLRDWIPHIDCRHTFKRVM